MNATLRLAVLSAILAATGPAAAKVAFPRADGNGDGVVTYDEARRAMPGLTEIHYAKADPNGDGVIDRREYPLLDSFYGYVVSR